MSEERSWTEIVLEALKILGADKRAVSIDKIYEAVKDIAPSKCIDSDVYVHEAEGRRFAEPRWKRDVRDALIKLKKRGLVSSEKRGLWRLAVPQT
jgi:hypothetical protein